MKKQINQTIDFFHEKKNAELFKKQFMLKLIFGEHETIHCSEEIFDILNLDYFTLNSLQERKTFISFQKWKTLQTSKVPIIQNIFWTVCETENLAHHEIRDGVNEVNDNLRNQGNILEKFLQVEHNGYYCCFWLYTKEFDKEFFFNATVMILPGIVDLFDFDDNGNCIHK
jgi:hypothetical protein